MNYAIIDGAGNRYSISKDQISYHPMTPENSSSGKYSGGEYKSRQLSKNDFLKVVDVCERAIWSTQDHTYKRTMGTMTLIKSLPHSSQTVILRRGTEAHLQVERVLTNIMR